MADSIREAESPGLRLRGCMGSIGRFWSRIRDHFGDDPFRRTAQYGAIPFQLVEGRTAFLLITSRRTGRWIFPKGSLMEGKSAPETAAQEALEEAGVEGVVFDDALGHYHTVKHRLIRQHIDVTVYPLLVTRQLDDWQEKGQRYRHWVMAKEAIRLVSDPGAVSAIKRLDAIAPNLHERTRQQVQGAV
ncbi:MAG: NUDIX hydrolase [Rhizobiaceae bacterium]|nr:NUDIX hydrolase [Rhizobiaceae bacterium]MCV0408330.1 NUDIX hydrolase [Rhizobiaceae bacterium]